MKKVFWFFREGEAYYEDQCIKALREGRIQEVPSIPTWESQEDYHEKWHHDEGEPYTREPYSVALEHTTRPYVVISEREWENLVYSANAQQEDIVNDPETNLPMIVPRPPVDPHSREALEQELTTINSRLSDLDYIGIKIATGRGTREEYANEISEMQTLADRKNAIKSELKEREISERIENKEYQTRQDARDTVGMLYTGGDITLDSMKALTVKIDEVYGDDGIQL